MHCISLNLRRMIKSGSLSIAACGLLIAVFPAWCGPPFVTDDPETLEYRHHELFIAVEQTNTPGGKTVTPMVDYSYGVLPDLQLGITVPYVFDSPSGQVRQHGLGDLVLGAKYRFVQETDARPMMTFAPLVTTANGDADKGLGNSGSQIFLPVWIQKEWGEWQGYGGGGYWINNAQGFGNHWYYGAVMQYEISGKVTVGAEMFHETGQLPADTSSTGFSVGGIYDIDRHNRLLLSVGRGLMGIGTQNRFSGYLAYALTW